jgi:hypothetical protein
MTKKYYRADKRCLKAGEVMLPEGTYQDRFPVAGKEMEKALDDARPANKPNRKESLFVFDDLKAVESYWRSHDGSYLYEVEIDEAALEHCGDMALTDQIGAEFRKPTVDRARVATLVETYWEERQSERPASEFLVRQARVVAKLKGKSDLKEWVKSQVTSSRSD